MVSLQKLKITNYVHLLITIISKN